MPKEVLVPALPEPVEPSPQWLAERRGSQVSLRIPQRGDKKALMETVQRNAQQALVLHKTKRASDLTTRSRALEEIAEALDLDSAPLRIECYDISHLQGDDVVASMVVFEDGLARKSEYRRFQIKAFEGQDDVRSMHEVISRRFRRYLREKETARRRVDRRRPRRSAPRRRLGRRPRTRRAAQEVRLPAPAGRRRRRPAPGRGRQARPWTSSASTTSPSAAWPSGSKRSGCPDEDDPVVLPRTSEGLYLLQRVRDEAHRFAITYQRSEAGQALQVEPAGRRCPVWATPAGRHCSSTSVR